MDEECGSNSNMYCSYGFHNDSFMGECDCNDGYNFESETGTCGTDDTRNTDMIECFQLAIL